MIAAHLQVGDAGKGGEAIPQVGENRQVLARLIVLAGLLRKERRPVEAEVGSHAPHPLGWLCLGGGGQAFEPRDGDANRAGLEQLTA